MKYEHEFETRAYELNINGQIKPTQTIQYLQETAEHQLKDQDVDYVRMYNDDRKAFIISRMNVEIYRPVYRYAHITTHTWIGDGRAANFPRYYDMFCDGECVARANSNWALIDVDSRKLIRLSEYDTSAYSRGEANELSIPGRFHLPKDADFKEVERYKVGFSLTDINRHMNNAMYINKLYDNIPGIERFFVTSINIRYVHEAVYGAEVGIYMSEMMPPGDIDPRAEKAVFFYTETNGETNVEAVFGLRSIDG